MSGERTLTLPGHLQALKRATKELIRAFGGQEAAAAETGRSQSRLAAYGLPNTADFAPIDVIDAIEDMTHGAPGWPHVTLAMCRRRGGMFVKLPDPASPPTQWSGYVGRLGREAGALIDGICTDLSDDNDVKPDEAAKRLTAAVDLVRVAVELEAALKARAGERDAR